MVRVRLIDPASDAEIDLVAERMRQTLVEVLGEARGTALYTMDWLRRRALFHLDPTQSTAAIFLSDDGGGRITGHTIVRIERDELGEPFGLFSTTYVEPTARRRGVAARLLARGEAWMRDHQMRRAVTYTAAGNQPLIGLYLRHGYRLEPVPTEMVRLTRELDDADHRSEIAPA
jgi:GNAT superfamily N-acetyltransferase